MNMDAQAAVGTNVACEVNYVRASHELHCTQYIETHHGCYSSKYICSSCITSVRSSSSISPVSYWIVAIRFFTFTALITTEYQFPSSGQYNCKHAKLTSQLTCRLGMPHNHLCTPLHGNPSNLSKCRHL
uniref:Alfin-like protein n=1 Tax=Ulva partita TaxID=1605170 RepID=A0A1C9ZPL8_9CHLO|nr:alfin-like protein [Ulva partita]